MFQLLFLNNNVTVSPGAFKRTLVYPLKFEGVIVIKFVPLDDVLMIVFTWPSEPSAKEHDDVADVASISVIAVVTLIAIVVEPSAVAVCDVCFRPKN